MAHELGSIAKELFVEAFAKPLYTDGAADFTPVDPLMFSQGSRSVEVTVLAADAAPIVAIGTKTEPSEGTSTKETIALDITVPLNELLHGVTPDVIMDADTMNPVQFANLEKKVKAGSERIKKTVDKARLAKLATDATQINIVGGVNDGDPDYTAITKDNVYEYIVHAGELANTVSGTMKTLFVSPNTYKSIKLGKVFLDTESGAEVVSSGQVGMLDGSRVVAVPSDRIDDEIDFMLVTYECAGYAGIETSDVDVRVIDASLMYPGSASLNGQFVGGAKTLVPAGVIVKLNKALGT